MKIKQLLTAGLMALLCVSSQAQNVVQTVLATTYGSGGQQTEWVPPSSLAFVLKSTPATWSGQTWDCSTNTCLNFPQPTPYTFPGVGTPTARTLSLATAYQATDPTRASVVTVNITSTATLSLSGGTTNTAAIVIGSTNAVASGTGVTVDNYSNTNTGTLTIGLNLATVSSVPMTFALPAGWFFAVRQTSGTVTISSAFDQSVG